MEPVVDRIHPVLGDGPSFGSERCTGSHLIEMSIGRARWEQWARYAVSFGRDPILIAWFDLKVVGASMKGQGWLWSRALAPNSSLNLGKTGYQKDLLYFRVPTECKSSCKLDEHCIAGGSIRATVNGADMSADIQAFIETCGESIPLNVGLTSKKKGGAQNELEVKVPKTGITYKRKWVSETGDYDWDSIHPTFDKRREIDCVSEVKSETVLDVGALNGNWGGNTIELVVDIQVEQTVVPKLSCKCPDPHTEPGDDHPLRTRERRTKEQLKTIDKLNDRLGMTRERVSETFARSPIAGTSAVGTSSGPRELMEIASFVHPQFAKALTGPEAERQAIAEIASLRRHSMLASLADEVWLVGRARTMIERDQLFDDAHFQGFAESVAEFADGMEQDAVALAANPATSQPRHDEGDMGTEVSDGD
jgi:hypothetical protein